MPCKRQVPDLRRLHGRFAGRGLTALGLSLDEDASAFRAAATGMGLPWPQGRLAPAATPAVSGVPTYWLLDPAGKILAKASDPDELVKVLKERLPE